MRLRAIKDAQNDIRHTEITLRSIQRLLQRLHAMGPRRELIQIDDLRITLADAMMCTRRIRGHVAAHRQPG
jgi:hypothetical protein